VKPGEEAGEIMRSLWFRGVTLGASVLLALFMLLINVVMQAVGSIPDVEACSFLAGSLVALLALYPLAACLVAARAARALARRFPNEDACIVCCGARIGLTGAALYFLIGVFLMAGMPPPLVWGLLLLYTLLAMLGGAFGAFLTIEKMRYIAWRSGEN
jgi:hypothetical protein